MSNTFKKVRYTVIEPKRDVNHLVIVFNGFTSTFDFEKSSNFFKGWVLQVHDDWAGGQSCYLGSDGSLEFDTELAKVIENFIETRRIDRDNVVLLGSSKGGFAALHFGLRHGFKKIVCSAPVHYLGSWMKDYSPEIFERVTGALSSNSEIVAKYDELMNVAIEEAAEDLSDFNVVLFLSNQDHFYEKYGQKALSDKLSSVCNPTIFYSESTLIDHHGQVSRYFISEILSVVNLLSYGMKLTGSPQPASLGMAELVASSPNLSLQPVNKLRKARIEGSRFYLDGLLYLKNLDQTEYGSTVKKLKFKKGADEKIFTLAVDKKPGLSLDLFSLLPFKYQTAGMTTPKHQGFDLTNVGIGNHELAVSVSQDGKVDDFRGLEYEGSEQKSIHQGFEYRLYSVDGVAFLSKKDVLADTYQSSSYVWDLRKIEVNPQGRLHLEGIYALPGIDVNSYNERRYYISLQNGSSRNVSSFDLGEVKNSKMSKRMGVSDVAYSTSYFSTFGRKGIEIQDLVDGEYSIYVTQSFRSFVHTVKLDRTLLIQKRRPKIR